MHAAITGTNSIGQLAFASLPMSAVSSFAGIASAVLYRSEYLPFRRLRFPASLSAFCARTILPLLQAPIQPGVQHRGANPDPQQMMHMQAAAAQMAHMAQMAQQGGGGGGAQQHAGAAVPAGAVGGNPPVQLVEALKAMGFSQEEATHALRATNNDIHAAVNLLTS